MFVSDLESVDSSDIKLFIQSANSSAIFSDEFIYTVDRQNKNINFVRLNFFPPSPKKIFIYSIYKCLEEILIARIVAKDVTVIVNAADASVSALLAPLDLGDLLALLVLRVLRVSKVSLDLSVPPVLKVLRVFRVSRDPPVLRVTVDAAERLESASA
jgi:hypothetical protein